MNPEKASEHPFSTCYPHENVDNIFSSELFSQLTWCERRSNRSSSRVYPQWPTEFLRMDRRDRLCAGVDKWISAERAETSEK
jgi:hypothetical protein